MVTVHAGINEGAYIHLRIRCEQRGTGVAQQNQR